MAKQRLIFFDILRILAICLVLVSHITIVSGIAGLTDFRITWDYLIGNSLHPLIGDITYLGIGNIEVFIFLIISGAVLELNKKKISDISSYLRFEGHRLLRLYPAYWMSLLFGIMVMLLVNANANLGNLLWQFSGFNAITGGWSGPINGVTWCIELFVVFYLLYPFISKAIQSNPFLTMAILIVVNLCSLLCLYGFSAYNPVTSPARWFPLGFIAWFGLGIFIVNRSWYPKATDKTGIISYLGELSFYVFLFHYLIIGIAAISIPLFIVYAFGMAAVAMLVDNQIHDYLKMGSVV
jgi:peptidoglycan/LPS O-acetylase OafA/YrhL